MTKVNIVNLNTVINIKSWLENQENVYIGRSNKNIEEYSKPGYAKWGNPYKLTDYKNRQEVVYLYKKYVLRTQHLIESVGKLRGKVLGCWCSPNLCHAHILHQLAGNLPVYQYPSCASYTDTMEGAAAVGRTFLDSLMENKKKILVGNLPPKMTENEIHELFGFKNPVLQQSCTVTITCDQEEDCHATLEVHENFVEDILKKNGFHCNGRELRVQSDPSSDSCNSNTHASDTAEGEVEIIQQTLQTE